MDFKEEAIKKRFEFLSRHLNEQSRRLFVAAEAKAFGANGISVVSEITGISRSVIATGLEELEGPCPRKNTQKRGRPKKENGRV